MMRNTFFKLLGAVFCTTLSFSLIAQTEFITTWQTDSTGTSGTTEITIPTTGTGYLYDVDWDNDGTYDTLGVIGDFTHDFTIAGTYTIRIQGDFPRIYFDGSGDRQKLVSVDQWGTNPWTSFRDAFNGCSYLIVTATDAPVLTGVTDCRNMFTSTGALTGDFSGWNTSTITNMASMFNYSGYNQSLDAWDVSSVTSFAAMFKFATFNGDVSSWITTSAQSMSEMFRSNNSFNQDVSGWDVSGVTTFTAMFYGDDVFNQDVSGWNVSSATDMGAMFRETYAFDQDLGEWDVSGVTNFFAFIDQTSMSIANYDSLLIGWAGLTLQTGIAFDAEDVRYCEGETSRDNIIANFGWTFDDGDLKCFDEALVITVKTDNTGTSSSTSIDLPVYGSDSYYDVDWDNDGTYDEFGLTGPVTHDYGTAGTYTISIVGVFNGLYFNNSGDKEKLLSVEAWGSLNWTNAENAFYGCSNLEVNATDDFDIYYTTSLSGMFRDCPLFNGDMSGWKLSDVTDISFMFNGCTSFNQDIGDWDTDKITTMESAFQNCIVLNQNFGWSTDNLVTLTNTFNGASLFDGNISSWDVDNLTDATGMLTGTSFSSFYDLLLNQWANHSVQSNVVMDIGFATYCHGEHAHDSLISIYGWTINDGGISCVDEELITTWKTDNAGTSGSTSITFPTFSTTSNYDVDWDNDGVYDEFGIQGSATHDFGTAGTYTIRVKGYVPFVYFGNGGDKDKILSVDQWGTNMWTSSYQAFYGCTNLQIPATDAPDLRAIGGLFRFFRGCTNLNSDLNHWDVSEIGSFNSTFMDCDSINQPFDNWDVSNAKAMPYMFLGADNFNQDITGWDVSSVSNMESTFQQAASFNQDISVWDVSQVTNMEGMFYGAYDFDQDLGSWNVENLTNAHTFFGLIEVSRTNYDNLLIGWSQQNLQSGVIFDGGQSKYCIGESARESMIADFGWVITDDGLDCTDLELISVWTTDNPGASGTTEITIPTNSGTYTYQYDVDWDDDGVYDTLGVIGDITHDYGVAGTNTVRIKGTFPQFYFNNGGDKDKIIDIQSWGNITWLSGDSAFYGCDSLNFTATDTIDLSYATSLASMFNGCDVFNSDISGWDVSAIENFSYMFSNASVFDQPLNDWIVSAGTTMSNMFKSASNFNQDLDNWNMSSVTDISQMFQDAVSFNKSLDNWNVSNVTTLDRTFADADAFNQDLNNWVVSNVTDMSFTFQGTDVFNGDISNWDVGNVEIMYATFSVASEFNNDIGNWNVENVTTMYSMFFAAPEFNQNLNNWEMDSVTNTAFMFFSATNFNGEVSDWTVSNVTTMQSMFSSCVSFDQNIGAWDVSNVTIMDNMFYDVTLSIDNYDSLLIGWNNQILQNGVDFDGGNSIYCNGFTARANMIASDNWIISDGGVETIAPVADSTTLSDITSECEITSLTAPTATDNCSSTIAVTNDATFPIDTQGTTIVTWTYDDGHGNTSSQTQNVIIDDITAPIADVATLSDFTADCEITSLTAPTATDNCSSTITVTNDATLPITTQGSTTIVTWTYDDGHGNTSTQTQNVIIDDITTPVADSLALSDVTSECEITSLTPPTATDGCATLVTVTNDATLPISTQGTTIVTWTYDDGHGNTITQTQNVVVQDVTPPTASNPSSISVQCTGDVPAVSTSYVTDEADNCSGVTVTFESEVSDGLSCPETITRTYRVTDAVGLFIDVVQTITVQDITSPIEDVVNLPAEIGFCDITLMTPTATDNCSGSLVGVSDVTFPINTIGTTTVTWTFTDDCGNTTTQTQDVTIDEIETGTSMASDNITIIADNLDAGVSYQWIHCSNNNLPVPGATGHNFTPMVGGDYAVIITQAGCSDTSDCVASIVGLEDLTIEIIHLYPNPSNGVIYIETESKVKDVQVLDMMGRRVEVLIDLDLNRIDGSQLVTGKYLIQITTEQNAYVKEVIVND